MGARYQNMTKRKGSEVVGVGRMGVDEEVEVGNESKWVHVVRPPPTPLTESA